MNSVAQSTNRLFVLIALILSLGCESRNSGLSQPVEIILAHESAWICTDCRSMRSIAYGESGQGQLLQPNSIAQLWVGDVVRARARRTYEALGQSDGGWTVILMLSESAAPRVMPAIRSAFQDLPSRRMAVAVGGEVVAYVCDCAGESYITTMEAADPDSFAKLLRALQVPDVRVD